MAFQKDSLVIEKIKSAFQTDVNGSIMWRADQLSDPTLSCSGETVYANDAEGTPIAAFYRNPGATFSATNAVFSVNLFQKQIGADKTQNEDATGGVISTPAYEIIDIKATEAGGVPATIDLSHTPADSSAVKYIYLLNTDKSIAQNFEVAVAASATQFAISGATITLPTSGIAVGDRIAVFYEYNSSKSAIITKSTEMYPEEGVLYIECLFCDVCQTANKVYGWIVFPRAKLDNNVELTLATDGFSQPISLEAMKDYCSTDQELFHMILSE